MASPPNAPVPLGLKAVQPFFVVSRNFRQRDAIVAYYVSMYAVQQGISLSNADPEAKAFLGEKLGELNELKQQLLSSTEHREAIGNDVVGQAHVETIALRMFQAADSQDRDAKFSRALVKSFFVTSHLFTSLKQFGELSEECEEKMKYAKWKAVEIDRCLKAGIAPTPGPPAKSGDEVGYFGEPSVPPPMDGGNVPSTDYKPVPKPRQPATHQDTPSFPPPTQDMYPPIAQPPYPPPPQQPPQPQQLPSYPPAMQQPVLAPTPSAQPVSGSGPSSEAAAKSLLGPEQVATAQKYCKFASSSLDYDDVTGAIEFMSKALHLLKTGKDLP